MPLENNRIWHLSHSANMLKLEGKVMIFDYANPTEDMIDPEWLKNEEVYVFASHAHGDHFHRDIFKWKNTVNNINYIISSDVDGCPDFATIVKPDMKITVGNIEVQTYPSTDCGVAFSVYVSGKHIYFAGDNAFWNWDGDLKEEGYVKDVLSLIDKTIPVDIAFQVCDPRLEGSGEGGIFAFARAMNPKILVPIHSFGKYGINSKAEKKLKKMGYKGTFWNIKRSRDWMKIIF